MQPNPTNAPQGLKTFITHIKPETHHRVRLAAAALGITIREAVELALEEFFRNHNLTHVFEQFSRGKTTL